LQFLWRIIMLNHQTVFVALGVNKSVNKLTRLLICSGVKAAKMI